MSSYSSMQKEVKFMEMKLLGICPIKEKFNAASVIEKIVRNKTTLPPEGPSYIPSSWDAELDHNRSLLSIEAMGR